MGFWGEFLKSNLSENFNQNKIICPKISDFKIDFNYKVNDDYVPFYQSKIRFTNFGKNLYRMKKQADENLLLNLELKIKTILIDYPQLKYNKQMLKNFNKTAKIFVKKDFESRISKCEIDGENLEEIFKEIYFDYLESLIHNFIFLLRKNARKRFEKIILIKQIDKFHRNFFIKQINKYRNF